MLKKAWKLRKMIRYWSFKETGASFEQKSISTKNHGKSIGPRRKTKQNWTRAKNFYVYFFVIFDCYWLSFQEKQLRTVTLPNFMTVLTFSDVLKSYVLRHLAIPEATYIQSLLCWISGPTLFEVNQTWTKAK